MGPDQQPWCRGCGRPVRLGARRATTLADGVHVHRGCPLEASLARTLVDAPALAGAPGAPASLRPVRTAWVWALAAWRTGA